MVLKQKPQLCFCWWSELFSCISFPAFWNDFFLSFSAFMPHFLFHSASHIPSLSYLACTHEFSSFFFSFVYNYKHTFVKYYWFYFSQSVLLITYRVHSIIVCLYPFITNTVQVTPFYFKIYRISECQCLLHIRSNVYKEKIKGENIMSFLVCMEEQREVGSLQQTWLISLWIVVGPVISVIL